MSDSARTTRTGALRRTATGIAAALLVGAAALSATGAAQAAPAAPAARAAGAFTSFGVADWDHDGNQDIIARDNSNGNLMLYPGTSTRGYSSATPVQIGNGWAPFTPFGVTDWDHDGNQDIIARNDNNGDLMLYPGRSVRGPSGIAPVKIGNGWAPFTPFGTVDWDHDGNQDIIARNNGTGDLMLYPGTSTRGYSSAAPVRIGVGWGPFTSFGMGDWDRDGKQDIVARNDNTGDLMLYPGSGTRGPSSAAPVRIGIGWGPFTSFGMGDWDRDGNQDLIVRDNTNRNLMLYPGSGTRGPSSATPVRIGNGW